MTLTRQISIIIAYLTTKGIFKVKVFCIKGKTESEQMSK